MEHFSRRALVTSATAIATVATLPAVVKSAPAERSNWLARREFVRQISGLHPNGGRVAIRALECGAEPSLLKSVQIYWRGHDERVPILRFDVRGKPRCEIVVSPSGGILHGPVL